MDSESVSRMRVISRGAELCVMDKTYLVYRIWFMARIYLPWVVWMPHGQLLCIMDSEYESQFIFICHG